MYSHPDPFNIRKVLQELSVVLHRGLTIPPLCCGIMYSFTNTENLSAHTIDKDDEDDIHYWGVHRWYRRY